MIFLDVFALKYAVEDTNIEAPLKEFFEFLFYLMKLRSRYSP
jgi:hypothetical protein